MKDIFWSESFKNKLFILMLISFYSSAHAQIAGDNYLLPHEVSGVRIVSQSSESYQMLIVHDTSKKNKPKLSLVTVEGDQTNVCVMNLMNLGKRPKDIEAIAIPENPDSSIMVLTSKGRLLEFAISIQSAEAELLGEARLPKSSLEKARFEGLDFLDLDGQKLIVWADRGKDELSGTIFWGWFEGVETPVTILGEAPLRVPYPRVPNTRHITDLALGEDGTIFITAASDGGNKGPFSSYCYLAGTFMMENELPAYKPSSLVPLYEFPGNKVEGLDIIKHAGHGSFVFGADNEDIGGRLFIH